MADITGCEILRDSIFLNGQVVNNLFTQFRYNQDLSDVIRNGKGLLCQPLDFRIVNGRMGTDKYIGRSTCLSPMQQVS